MESGMPHEFTVQVIDPDAATAERMESLLGDAARVARYASLADFESSAPHPRPGCIVLELGLPGEDALAFIRQQRCCPFPIAVIVLTAGATVRRAVDAMAAGATFVLEKPGDNGILQQLIQSALQRDAEHVRQCEAVHEIKARLNSLSPREREVAGHIFQGLETKVIASRLGISPKTVEYHRAQIFAKMDVTNSVQLTVAMVRCEQCLEPVVK
jgi:two-component system response regulator FixJ